MGTNGSLVLEVDTSVEVNKHTPVLNARKRAGNAVVELTVQVGERVIRIP